MTLFWIILATTVAGILSIAAAASLSLTILSRMVDKMVSLSVGVLLSTALLHSLPEAFTTEGVDIPALFLALFIGLLGFFVLEKAALLRHTHHHEHDGHGHHHGHDAESAGRSGFVILLGDGLHNFADGVLIAAAFLADPQVGILTAVAISLHEIPQEIGDFIVLLNAGFTKTRALVYNLISSFMAVIGGVLGYFFLDKAEALIPYVIVFASSSFIYIAVSDLMPQMHRRPKLKESVEQLVLIILGVVLVLSIAEWGHISHAH